LEATPVDLSEGPEELSRAILRMIHEPAATASTLPSSVALEVEIARGHRINTVCDVHVPSIFRLLGFEVDLRAVK
jgi:hypothetical protein